MRKRQRAIVTIVPPGPPYRTVSFVEEILVDKILTHLRNLLPAFKPGTSIRIHDMDTGEGDWRFLVVDNRKGKSARRKRWDRLTR